jgi:L-lactate dehydrogenase complex protein LldG
VSARERILDRVRAAIGRRDTIDHPGDFEGWRPPPPAGEAEPAPVEAFRRLFEAAGGEVARVADDREAVAWLAEFASSFATATAGATVPESLRPALPGAPPDEAALGVSMARAAVGETGSLVMDARDGRRAQLLVPTHVVFVQEAHVFATLRDALRDVRADLPSAIGLHSGPSKSADIGQIMVKGVHGPGRVVAVLIAGSPPGNPGSPPR